MKIVTVSVQKGGVGKTTTAAALAQAAAYKGRRVLAVDLDPQGHFSIAIDADMGAGNTYQLLTGTPAANLIQTTPQGIDAIPAAWELSTLTTEHGSARRLQRALKPIRGRYDIIVIDTPTISGELQYNAMQASTDLVIPVWADTFSLQALYLTVDTARQIQKTNPELNIAGIVFTNFRGTTNHARQLRDIVTGKAEELGVPCLGAVRVGIAVQEAATFRRSLFEYAGKSNPAHDYLNVYEQLIAQGV